ncbi:MAG: hypothetical protein WC197_02635 [Candidatus Gastranaerophilaceae bacterium]
MAEIIEDDVALQAFKGQNLSKPVYKLEIIEDAVALQSFKGQILSKPVFNNGIIEDNVAMQAFKGQILSKPVFHIKLIDENAEIVRVLVKADHYTIRSKNLTINQKVCFVVVDDVKKNKELFIRKNTPMSGMVETITKAGWAGDPAELIIGRFTTTDVNGNKIDIAGEIIKTGANRAYWVRPVFYTGELLPPYSTPLLLVYFIKGGNAKITPRKKFTLYYE